MEERRAAGSVDVVGGAAAVRAYAGLVVCVATWGLVFVATAKLLPHVDAIQLVTVRFVLVALVCVLLLAVAPRLRPSLTRAEGWRVLGCAVLAVPGAQYVIVEAQNYLAPSLAALIVTFSPAVAALLAARFLRTRLRPVELLGFGIALAGVVLVLVLGAGSGSARHASSPLGAAIAVVSPISWAGYTLLVAPLASRHAPVGVVALVMIAGALLVAPTYPHAAAGLSALDAGDWGWMAALVLGGTIVPNLLWVVSLRALPVHRTSAFMYLVPLFATLWSALLLGRTPQLVVLPGAVLVLFGVFLTQGRRRPVEPAVAPPAS